MSLITEASKEYKGTPFKEGGEIKETVQLRLSHLEKQVYNLSDSIQMLNQRLFPIVVLKPTDQSEGPISEAINENIPERIRRIESVVRRITSSVEETLEGLQLE